MSHLEDPPTPLEAALSAMCARLGAERWVLCRLDGGAWATEAMPALPRDQVYLSAIDSFERVGDGWAQLGTSEMPNAGPRLQVAGVAGVAVFRSNLRRALAFAVFENPDPTKLDEVFYAPVPSELSEMVSQVAPPGLHEGSDDRWDHELRALWHLLPALGLFAGGQADERAVAERTAGVLDARALVALTPTPTGVAAVTAVRSGDGWTARSVTLEGQNWDVVTATPNEILDLALKESQASQVMGPWSVGWAVGRRLFLGVASGGRRPSQEALDLVATLLGWGFGQAEGNAAAGQHALLRERSRIASVIHEGLTQVVTNVAIQLQILENYLDDPVKAKEMVNASRDAVLQALDDLRGAIFELAPRESGSDDLAGGLTRYIADFGAQWGIEVAFKIEGESRPVDPEIVALIFAFVQEGLTNVRKHAEATEAIARLSFKDDLVGVEVRDEGVGFDPESGHVDGYRLHQGLNLLRSRVWLMGGRIEVESTPEEGSSLRMEISS